jgi:hypothetical protein
MPRAQDHLPSHFRRALLYVVEQLGEVNVTKLQKILYLADLEHFHATGTTLTGARWVRYTKGPMAKALVPSRTLMDGSELDVSIESWGGYEAHVYRPGPRPRFRPDLASEERATLDRIIELTRDLSTNDAIRLAYNTSPMRVIQAMERAQGGQLLLDVDLPLGAEPSVVAEAITPESRKTPEQRAAFKRREASRIGDLQRGAVGSSTG